MDDDALKFKAMDIIGSSGLTRFGGYVFEEWLPELQGRKGIKVYKEMRDNDPIIGSILFAIKMLVRQVDWTVEAASDNAKDKEAAEFLEQCLDDMTVTWTDTISEVLSMLPFGWAWLEICYKKRVGPNEKDGSMRSKYNDGRIGWRKLPLRAQETFQEWVFDEDGSVVALVQSPPPDFTFRTIPIEKSLLFRLESHKGNPEGRSLFRNAYRPWYFRKNIEEIEGIGIERGLVGLPVAYVPPSLLAADAGPEEKRLLQSIYDLVVSVRRDKAEGVVFPSKTLPDGSSTGFDFQLMSTDNRRQFDTNATIDRYDKKIAMIVLADFIFLGHGATGSFALSSDKTDLFVTALGTILGEIEEVFNRYAIPRLIALNDFDGLTDFPKLKHGDVEKPDLNILGAFLTAMKNCGVLTTHPELEEYLRTLAELPDRPEDAPMPSDTPPPAPGSEEGEEPPPPLPTGNSEEEMQKRDTQLVEILKELKAAINNSFEDGGHD